MPFMRNYLFSGRQFDFKSLMFFLKEYYPALIYLCFSLLLASVIFGASYTLAMSEADSEKLSSYECGFDPYEDARY